MMTPRQSTSRSVIGYSLGFLGVLFVIATLGVDATLHVLARPELPRHLMYAGLTAGAVIGWWGFFWADGRRAKDGGGFLITASERLKRAGRRDTDSIAVVAEPSPPVDVPAPDIPPTGGFPPREGA